MRNPKILLIEDEAELAQNIIEILKLNDFEVIFAENGEVGINLALKEIPDLIISDIVMPLKTGYDVIDELRKNKQTKTIPIIFLTAKVSHEDFRKGMGLGADDYIFKPFKSQDLIDAIRIRLEKVNAYIMKDSEVSEIENQKKSYDYSDQIILTKNNKSYFVKLSSIVQIEAERQYSKVFTNKDDSFIMRKALNDWEEILPENNFIRIHRGRIINIEFIDSIIKTSEGVYQVKIKNSDISFTISRNFVKKIKSLYKI